MKKSEDSNRVMAVDGDTDSVLNGRPVLAGKIYEVAEVAGYLWQKGWAERNGGNITVNITDFIDPAMRRMPAIAGPFPIGFELPDLKGCWFYSKGTQKRMRDLARYPMLNGSIIRINDNCSEYEIIADYPIMPTSELPSHLAVHNYLLHNHSPYRAVMHTHPIELVAISHNRKYLQKDVATKILWSMIPETKAFCPRGLGVVPYMLPGSKSLAEASLSAIDEGYDVVLWEKHGVLAVDTDIMSAFDQVDVLNKAAQIWISSRNLGFEPEGMSEAQMQEITDVFHLPK